MTSLQWMMEDLLRHRGLDGVIRAASNLHPVNIRTLLLCCRAPSSRKRWVVFGRELQRRVCPVGSWWCLTMFGAGGEPVAAISVDHSVLFNEDRRFLFRARNSTVHEGLLTQLCLLGVWIGIFKSKLKTNG